MAKLCMGYVTKSKAYQKPYALSQEGPGEARKPMNKWDVWHFTIAAPQAENAFDEANWT